MPNSTAQNFSHLAKSCHLDITLPPPIQDSSPDSAVIHAYLNQLNEAIDAQVVAHGIDAPHHIADLIKVRTLAIDMILVQLFDCYQFPKDFALFAVGGYGRGELLPASDVDILLIGDKINQAAKLIESFVAMLWDIGITPAFSVRSVDEMRTAVSDQTIASAMLEARILVGNEALSKLPSQVVKAVWDAKSFYDAKMAESKARYLAHNATEYNLEPNIKNAPGGLRDIHIIGWFGRFYFGSSDIASLATTDFINENECAILQAGQHYLWCIRHHLHTLAGRGEDRLLFDYQKAIAERFGYYTRTSDTTHREVTQALEAMMRVYYQHAMKIAAFSEVLCEYFYENYLATTARLIDIDETFYLMQSDCDHQSRPAKIAIRCSDAFLVDPANLLKIFLVMGQKGIRQIAASTLRAIYAASDVIDEDYRNNPMHRQLFLANLQELNYLFHRLRLMKRFGVLGNYLPAFGKIMGLMQYDLFHRYTVDAHTLLLVRILHRFGDDRVDNQDKYGLVTEVYQRIARKDILVIAAIFHDIAKGRGGDHSKLGAADAYEFCVSHGMSETDSELVRWLVLEHLTMSLIAQKQDISDPEVIAKFAEFTRSITRLNHLYVLTVADMNATNSQLWNTWRATLLKQLYVSVHQVHSLGSHIVDKDIVITNRKNKAQNLLPMVENHRLKALWDGFGEEYFLKQKHMDIAWQSAEILAAEHKLKQGEPIIAIREHGDVSLRGMQLLICAPDQDNLFATTVCILDQLGLSVLDATILSASIDGISTAVDSYVIIDRLLPTDSSMPLLMSPERTSQMISGLKQGLKAGGVHAPSRVFEMDGKLKHFTVPTQVHFSEATSLAHQGHHKMHLITKDRPSLLAKVGAVFSELNIQVHGARITTLGERAEDVFYLSGLQGASLDDETLAQLKDAIIQALG
ncbi:[protein-PII] uridylyltransferase [Moraxella canis]|uniref:Bifunctional uridylyltransferase/uridylyl-removing enzyme n=1 Tax=Moraxella canis TaxID=90239 RepID=A0A1S9ZJ11_9GAMM|nr:[protein-PII] uridylyltransferase [Moraxella canis]OOR83031.1 [protein-PII] uridylyltransferase [Moraxella canis]